MFFPIQSTPILSRVPGYSPISVTSLKPEFSHDFEICEEFFFLIPKNKHLKKEHRLSYGQNSTHIHKEFGVYLLFWQENQKTNTKTIQQCFQKNRRTRIFSSEPNSGQKSSWSDLLFTFQNNQRQCWGQFPLFWLGIHFFE